MTHQEPVEFGDDRPAPRRDEGHRILAFVRRNGILIGAWAAVCLVAGLLWGMRQEPMYVSTAVASVQPILNITPGGYVSPADIEIFIQILESAEGSAAVAAATGQQAGVSIAIQDQTTPNVVVTSTSPSPEAAAAVANGYVAQLQDVVRTSDLKRNAAAAQVVQSRLDAIGRDISTAQATGASQTVLDDLVIQQRSYRQQLISLADERAFINQGRVVALNPAQVPTSPSGVNRLRTALLGLLFGLASAIAFFLGKEYLRDILTTKEDFEHGGHGVPVLGAVPLDKLWTEQKDTQVAILEQPSSPTAESYRTLRTSLRYIHIDEPIKRLQVTSPRPQDGKSATAVNLAIVTALAGRSVLLIDLDLRRPRLHHFLHLDNDLGFTTLMVEPDRRKKAIRQVEGIEHLSFLSAGPIPPNPSELLESAQARELIDDLAGKYDMVIIDSPPVLGLSDALVISSLADATVLVAKSAAVTRRDYRQTIATLKSVKANLVGTVVNGVDPGWAGRYGYGSYYVYQYGPSTEKP